MPSGGKSDKSALSLLVGVVYAASLKMRPGQRIRIRAYVVYTAIVKSFIRGLGFLQLGIWNRVECPNQPYHLPDFPVRK